jgi:hypothetical protein
MYTVRIQKILCVWALSVESDTQVLWVYTAQRYIDVLGIAQILKLHVDEDQTLTKGVQNV